MTAPNPIAILADLKNSIASIVAGQPNGPSTYKSTVNTVEVVPKTWTWTTVPPGNRPFVGIIPFKERPQNQPANYKRCVLEYAIIALVAETDGDAKLSSMSNLEDDLTAAIEGGTNGVNTTRGGNAVMSTIVGIDREYIADPIQGALKIDLEIVYFRNTWST